MQLVRLSSETDFEGWRSAARALYAQGIAPELIEWRVGENAGGLFDSTIFESDPQSNQPHNLSQAHLFSSNPVSNQLTRQLKVPREFIELCRKAILHNDPARFGLLYRLLWRMQQEPKLMQVSFDPDVAQVQAMVKAVQRDLHKMKAFVRFREIEMDDGESEFIAWFEPSHHIIEASAPFFTSRFTNMRWSILTPEICMHWDGKSLHYSPGASKDDAPTEDAGEDLWRSYYRSIFNPARLKVSAMQAQMPKKYWRNLPEAPLIAELIMQSTQRMDRMIGANPTEPQRKIVKYVAKKDQSMSYDPVDAVTALRALNTKILASTDFPLALHATQAVLGVGSMPSQLMIIGEQPGDQEDLAGVPFIGPAGTLLNQALKDAGIKRADIYMTNAVKHFKFTLMRNRRQHRSPDIRDIKLYQPWLQGEIAIVQPQVIVALGATAARAISGKALGVEDNRGKVFSLSIGRKFILSYHPSYLIRTPDEETKQIRYERLVHDLKLAAKACIDR
jgi:probable DNA metabolism protein